MKTLTTILTLALITISSAVMAQDFEIPKTGAKIYLTSNQMELSPNADYTFDLWVVRSNKARRAKFEAPRLSGSKDLEFTVEANSADTDNYKVTVKTRDVAPGKYFYTITSKSTGVQRISGTTISFIVGNSKSVASANSN
ncbi:MAG: hypothetical protein GY816_20605 [Cytophagales bacterium]|nr:hypothetical protein [Cytophagales bacterium]